MSDITIKLPDGTQIGIGIDVREKKKAEKNQNEEDKSRFTVDYYLAQLPKEKMVLDSISKERNFAYFQLGLINKDKFKEYTLAKNKLEKLLKQSPEERLVLPSKYNLYNDSASGILVKLLRRFTFGQLNEAFFNKFGVGVSSNKLGSLVLVDSSTKS